MTKAINQGITWQIMAGAGWSILLVLLLWLCNTVNRMEQDMAVVKNMLHIGSQSASNKQPHD